MSGRSASAVDVPIFASRAANVAWLVGSALTSGARSTLMQQGDLAAGLLDASGRVIALDEHLPLMAFSLAPSVSAIIKMFGSDIADGDIFIHNDVWHGNIQHADVGIFIPAFYEGRLAAWIGCRGHWADIGGNVAGTANPSAVEVWQEALRIPPLRIARRGDILPDVWALIFANVRMNGQTMSDCRAQIGACRIGVDETARLIARCGGVDAFDACCDSLFAWTSEQASLAFAALPQHRVTGRAVYIDDAPEGVTRWPIEVAFEVVGDRIRLDFTGTAAGQAGMMNAPLESTKAAALVTLLTLLGRDIDHNHGILSRIEIDAPVGCMLNAQYPAATFGGNKLCEYIGSAINAALGDALADHVSAEWSRRLSMRVSGHDPRSSDDFHEIFFLTYGGGGATDGCDGYDQPGLMSGGNVVSKDYEEMELQAPLTIWTHEYREDAAGTGRWRGGHGNETIVEHRGTDLYFVTHGGGTIEGATGIAGGGTGAPNALELILRDGSIRPVHAREKVGPLQPPVFSRQITGGGGGYGRATGQGRVAGTSALRDARLLDANP